MDWGIFELSTALVVLFLTIYYYFKSPYDFWSSRKVAGPKPSLLFGNFKDLMLSRLYIGDFVTKIYNEFKNEPFIGLYARRTPIIMVNDPEYIKDVLIKDFTIFASRHKRKIDNSRYSLKKTYTITCTIVYSALRVNVKIYGNIFNVQYTEKKIRH